MSQLVTIFGGSGFVGRYIARRMAKAGWRVRVAVRNPDEALFVKPYGVVGQVEPIFCNIRDDASVSMALDGADAAVNCVGTFDKSGKNNFQAVQVDAPARIARIAQEKGLEKLVHISSIGADTESESAYSRSKAEGEAALREAFPTATILRPSIIFGPEDQFFNRFASMTRMGPVLPVVGAGTKFQPVYVDDVAAAAETALLGSVSGVYELGGPDVETFRDLMQTMLQTIHRRRLVVNIPFWAARIMASVFGIGQAISLGIVKAPITSDQVKSLGVDNIANPEMPGLTDLGITPTAMEAVLPDYLWRFRPSGQYDAIKDSAKNLKST